MSQIRFAIIGAGPAGIYAADIILKTIKARNLSDTKITIDLFERLPAPFGLVRYGVAPDHPRIKAIINALAEVLTNENIRLFCNVNYGTDLSLDDLKEHYHAVIFATGATEDAELSIPGIEAENSFGAAAFVSWYDGHPDFPKEWPLTAKEIAVIGNGNVALDVARILVKHAEDLLVTEIPDSIFEQLNNSPVTDVHVFGRRGPAQVKFSPLELRELGELRDVDLILYDEDFDYDEATLNAIATNKQVMVIDRIMQQWRGRETGAASRRLHLHFFSRPAEVISDETGKVSAIRVERTASNGSGEWLGTGEFRDYPVQSVYRAIGYFGSELEELPFDEHRGVIPNQEGRVLRADQSSPEQFNEVMPGVYATGWIKRGPVGLIGHTKSDAMETIEHLLSDQANWWAPSRPEPEQLTELLEERGVRFFDYPAWLLIDNTERSLGEARGRERLKIIDREELTKIARSEKDIL